MRDQLAAFFSYAWKILKPSIDHVSSLVQAGSFVASLIFFLSSQHPQREDHRMAMIVIGILLLIVFVACMLWQAFMLHRQVEQRISVGVDGFNLDMMAKRGQRILTDGAAVLSHREAKALLEYLADINEWLIDAKLLVHTTVPDMQHPLLILEPEHRDGESVPTPEDWSERVKEMLDLLEVAAKNVRESGIVRSKS